MAPALIFLHVPKAAGTTFLQVLLRQVDRASAHLIGQPVREAIEAFKALPAERRSQLRLLGGHMSFGLHRHLPQPSAYVTFLRHPVDRAVSTYHYIRRTPHHRHHHALTSRRMDVEAFVRSGLSRIASDNGQVRLLAGVDDVGAALEPGACSPALLEQARANVRGHFVFTGVAELFDESLILMRRRLGWRQPYYRRQNLAPGRPAAPDPSAGAVAAIEALNPFDVALYTSVRRDLVRALRAQPPDFWIELRFFRWLNALYQRGKGRHGGPPTGLDQAPPRRRARPMGLHG